MPTGKVKFYDDEKGFGFIRPTMATRSSCTRRRCPPAPPCAGHPARVRRRRRQEGRAGALGARPRRRRASASATGAGRRHGDHRRGPREAARRHRREPQARPLPRQVARLQDRRRAAQGRGRPGCLRSTAEPTADRIEASRAPRCSRSPPPAPSADASARPTRATGSFTVRFAADDGRLPRLALDRRASPSCRRAALGARGRADAGRRRAARARVGAVVGSARQTAAQRSCDADGDELLDDDEDDLDERSTTTTRRRRVRRRSTRTTTWRATTAIDGSRSTLDDRACRERRSDLLAVGEDEQDEAEGEADDDGPEPPAAAPVETRRQTEQEPGEGDQPERRGRRGWPCGHRVCTGSGSGRRSESFSHSRMEQAAWSPMISRRARTATT